MRKSTLERYWEEEEFKGFFHDLLAESGLERINEYVQHGSTTRLLHSLAVAYYSYRLARFTRLSFHWQELVRGRPSPRLFPLRRPGWGPRPQGPLDAPSPHRRGKRQAGDGPHPH